MSIIGKVITKFQMRNPICYTRKVGVTIDKDCRLTRNPGWGSEPWLIKIGEHVLLSAEVRFITHDAGTLLFRDTEKYRDVFKFAPSVIHDNCFIGMQALIIPGVEIGPNSIIAAGSIVTRSVPPGEVRGRLISLSQLKLTPKSVKPISFHII